MTRMTRPGFNAEEDTSVARTFSSLVGMRSGPEDLVGSRSFSKVAIPIQQKKYLDMDYLPCVATLNRRP